MTSTTLIFYPDIYIGFNKTQLLERRLSAAGVIGSKSRSSPTFSVGPNFRQFVPRVDPARRYQHGAIRIRIQSVSVWNSAYGEAKIFERSNVILLEGDSIGQSPDSYALLRELLCRITGDLYRVDVADGPLRLGISELHSPYA